MNASPTSRRSGILAALRRLFGRTRSHRLDFAVGQSRSGKQDALAFSAVARESELILSAPFYRWRVPRADAGGGGVNLAHIAANVSAGDAGLSTRSLELALPTPQNVAVTQTDWPAAPPTAALSLRWNERWSKRTSFLFTCLQAHGVPLLSPYPGKARDGMAWFAQHIPLLRERLSAEEESEGQIAARRRLAAASGADEADIQVAGVYPRVPLTLVRQIALADGGRSLRLWLHTPRGRRPMRLWTVTLGRLHSTGRTVQIITEDKTKDADI